MAPIIIFLRLHSKKNFVVFIFKPLLIETVIHIKSIQSERLKAQIFCSYHFYSKIFYENLLFDTKKSFDFNKLFL